MKRQLLLGSLTLTALAGYGQASLQPNVLLIVIDDTGWNALSTPMDSNEPLSGSSYYRTPNLAKVADSGARFSYAYSAAPTSGPSRHSIQFGMSPTTMNIFAECKAEDLRADEQLSLANVIKAHNPNYATAHLGKWHVLRSPEQLGYDLSDGETRNKEGNSTDPTDPKLTFSISKRANEFISEQVAADNPFFLQVSYYANHLDYQALDETIEEFETLHAKNATQYQNSALWAAMHNNLDRGIGSILEHLEQLGIDDNTYVIITADNGYELKEDSGKAVEDRGFYMSYPLLSHKYQISEGGVRVPFIIAGPGVKKGLESTTPVVGYDIYPTILEMIGLGDKTPQNIEGGSLLGLSRGVTASVERTEPFLVFRYTKTLDNLDIAIVQDQYKLLKEIKSGKMHLWNLHEDKGEQVNLIDQMPDKAAQMYQAMSDYFDQREWNETMAGPLPHLLERLERQKNRKMKTINKQ